MKVSGMLGADLEMAPLAIAELERRGFDTAFSAEINNDPYFPLVLAAEHSERIALSTSISTTVRPQSTPIGPRQVLKSLLRLKGNLMQ